MPTPHELDEIILAAAKSDAQYDGRPWNSLSRAEVERYKNRATMSVDATLKRLQTIVEKEYGDVIMQRCTIGPYSCTPEHGAEAGYLLNVAATAYDRDPNMLELGSIVMKYAIGDFSVDEAVDALNEDLVETPTPAAATAPAKKTKAKAA